MVELAIFLPGSVLLIYAIQYHLPGGPVILKRLMISGPVVLPFLTVLTLFRWFFLDRTAFGRLKVITNNMIERAHIFCEEVYNNNGNLTLEEWYETRLGKEDKVRDEYFLKIRELWTNFFIFDFRIITIGLILVWGPNLILGIPVGIGSILLTCLCVGMVIPFIEGRYAATKALERKLSEIVPINVNTTTLKGSTSLSSPKETESSL